MLVDFDIENESVTENTEENYVQDQCRVDLRRK